MPEQFSVALQLAVDYYEAGQTRDEARFQAIRRRIADSDDVGFDDVLAVMAGLLTIVAGGDDGDERHGMRAVRAAALEMDTRDALGEGRD